MRVSSLHPVLRTSHVRLPAPRTVVIASRDFSRTTARQAKNRIYPNRVRNEDELQTLILMSASRYTTHTFAQQLLELSCNIQNLLQIGCASMKTCPFGPMITSLHLNTNFTFSHYACRVQLNVMGALEIAF